LSCSGGHAWTENQPITYFILESISRII